jgi:hypothetical protein
LEITVDVNVEELLEVHPEASGFLADNHVVCIVCGEPYWGTLGELMANKGIDDSAGLVERLKDFLALAPGS